MVHRPITKTPVSDPWSMYTLLVTQMGGTPRLIECDPRFYQVSQTLEAGLGIGLKGIGCFPVGPPPCILQNLGQIPVVEGRYGFNACGLQGFCELPVIGQSLWIKVPGTSGKDPGPGDGEAVGLYTRLLHQGYILFVAVVLVASHGTTL